MHLRFFLLTTILVQRWGFSYTWSVLFSSHAALPDTKSISVCDICIDIVTDIDQWLTAEHTEADIVAWVEQVQEQLQEMGDKNQFSEIDGFRFTYVCRVGPIYLGLLNSIEVYPQQTNTNWPFEELG